MAIINPQELAQAAAPEQLAPSTTPALPDTQPQAQPAQQQLAPAPPKPTFWTYQQAKAAGTMDPTFAVKLEKLIAASNAAGYPVRINSGFRTDAQQQNAINEAIKSHGPGAVGYWAAPVGSSNHQRGEAADLGGDTTWIHQHAAEFGLTFPMSWEPWHIEPQGLRKDSPAQAYTTGPVGTLNPTVDPGLDSSPHEFAAAASNLLTGSWMPSAQSLPAGQVGVGQYSLPTVSGIRAGSVTGTLAPTSSAGGGASLPASPSQQAFIDQIRPFAEAESKRTGIPPEVMITQAGVETGWGTSGWWRNNLNPAGIGVTGQAGAGNSYGSIAQAFHDYANKLMGQGEAGQEKFAADVKAGAPVEQLLADLEQSPWAAGHYGGNGLSATYSALNSQGAFNAPQPAPAQAAPAAPLPENQRRNRVF